MLTFNNNSRINKGFSIALLATGLLVSYSASAEKFYKWQDEKGSTHYTQTPPPKAYVKKSSTVNVDTTQPPVVIPPSTSLAPNNQPTSGNNTQNSPQSGSTIPPAPSTPFATPALNPNKSNL